MMNKSRLLEVLASLDMHPSRKLGQNFLLDPNMLAAIVHDAGVQRGERILEVGPGLGMLTEALLEAGADLTCVELDHRLASYLREHLGAGQRFKLVEGDACRVDFDEIMGDAPYRCVANLPYSCSTPFLANISTARNSPLDLTVLLQLEMAERLCASPGSKEYGAPTVKVALQYDVRILRHVDRKVFFPPPEVTSALVRFKRNQRCPDAELRRRVERLVTLAFQQRRKKSATQLSPHYPGVDVAAAFRAVGLNPDIRPDSITINAYIALAERLTVNVPPPVARR